MNQIQVKIVKAKFRQRLIQAHFYLIFGNLTIYKNGFVFVMYLTWYLYFTFCVKRIPDFAGQKEVFSLECAVRFSDSRSQCGSDHVLVVVQPRQVKVSVADLDGVFDGFG